MKILHVNDEAVERLRAFVVDPFDDTPNTVLMRLIDIANKAKSRCRPFTLIQEEGDSECVIPSSMPIEWRIL
jgi:hypothetical protein